MWRTAVGVMLVATRHAASVRIITVDANAADCPCGNRNTFVPLTSRKSGVLHDMALSSVSATYRKLTRIDLAPAGRIRHVSKSSLSHDRPRSPLEASRLDASNPVTHRA